MLKNNAMDESTDFDLQLLETILGPTPPMALRNFSTAGY
jgi:hypothetical protein